MLERVRIERPGYELREWPLISAAERSAIPPLLAELKKNLDGSDPSHVASVLGMLSYALPKPRGMTTTDTEALLTVYAQALADIPPDVLNAAGLEAVKTLKFFPKVAELRELAAPEMARRKAAIYRLEKLAERYDNEPPEPELVEPKMLADLRQRIGAAFPSKREATA